jgi:hypothetical protein
VEAATGIGTIFHAKLQTVTTHQAFARFTSLANGHAWPAESQQKELWTQETKCIRNQQRQLTPVIIMKLSAHQPLRRFVLLPLLLASCFGLSICSTGTCAEANKATERPTVASLASKTVDALKEIVTRGKAKLGELVDGKVDEVDKSLHDLQETVLAASERAKRLSEWDMGKIEKEAEQTFDLTILALTDYLDLVKDDGPVHKASNRIRTAALEKSRSFREKATSKESKRYAELAKDMDLQAGLVVEIWGAISKERELAVKELSNLKEAKELYVDVKSAQGIRAAVKELEKVRDDLGKIRNAMVRVQNVVAGEKASSTRK